MPPTPDLVASNAPLARAARGWSEIEDQPRMGIGVSLPVQNDSFGKLCELAGEFGLNQLGGFLERASAPGPLIEAVEKARNVAGFVTGNLPGFFCSPIGGEVPQNIQELFGKHAVDACKAELDGRRQFEVGPGGPSETEEKYRTDDGRLLTADEYTKECAEKKKKEGNDKLKKNFASGKEDYDLTECGTPAKVWEWATNGNYFMRSFGQVSKDAPMLARDDKGLEIADGDATGNVLPAEVPDEITAHAETYFDCGGPWRDCKGDAMWSLRWRARLRRVQRLEKLLSTAIEPAIVSTLTAMLNESGNKFVENANRKSDDETHIPHILVPKIKDTVIYRHIKNEGQKAAYESNFFSGPGQFVIDNASGDSLVH